MYIINIKDKELRALATLRYEEYNCGAVDDYSQVGGFLWSDTPEGCHFWRGVERESITEVNQTFENKVESNPFFCKTPKAKTVDEERKATPIFAGVLQYFPDAIKAVAQCSQAGNEQHHAGEPLHWDRSKSTDHAGSLTRHLMDIGTLDTDGIRHAAKVAWRALALLQTEIESDAKGKA